MGLEDGAMQICANGGRFFWKAIVVVVACIVGLYVHMS